MERNSKVIAIVALCIGVVGLSLGFAAFSAQLTVSSTATVTVDQDSQFRDLFGFMPNTQKDVAQDTKTAEAGNIATDYDKNWTGITYDFTDINQTVTYTATVKNDSNLAAYLDEVSTPTITRCDAPEGTAAGLQPSADLLAKACGEIKVAVTAPEIIASKGEGTVQVVITGPKTALDGSIEVVFSDVTIDYTTTNPNPVQG